MAKFPPPRPHTADQACDDLIELFALAVNTPRAAKALEDFFKTGRPIFDCRINPDATKIAGHFVHDFELDNGLKAHLTALRAANRIAALS